jgi:hypothetical protein
MYPHERSLVKKMEGKRFVLIGVNSDGDKEALRKVLADEHITWRSFWDQKTSGPISSGWKIQGWPTLFLIDHKGVIREKWVGSPGGDTLDRAVEKLVQEAEEER